MLKRGTFIHVVDNVGEFLGFIKTTVSFDLIEVETIASKSVNDKEWEKGFRDHIQFIDLRKVKSYKIYDSPEEFCEVFFDVVL